VLVGVHWQDTPSDYIGMDAGRLEPEVVVGAGETWYHAVREAVPSAVGSPKTGVDVQMPFGVDQLAFIHQYSCKWET